MTILFLHGWQSIGTDHRLADPDSLNVILNSCDCLLIDETLA
jgi:hypothetical protein